MTDHSHLTTQDISTNVGTVRGVVHHGLCVFRGLRYARACTTATRFAPPQPLEETSTLMDARKFAAPPVQPARSPNPENIYGNIDCLNLNIWAPESSLKTGGLPVMVWIPGGGFMRCDANDPLYDGSHFAHKDIIFVTVNYRVGVEGFLQLPGMAANRGLQDLLLALNWVQQHIGNFGGDPARVTVVGQSAGSGAIACLMGMPQANGLFHQAILQSPSTLVQTMAEAQMAAYAIADLANCPATLEGLASISSEKAATALAKLSLDGKLRQRYGLGAHHRFALRPVIDGQIVASSPLQAIKQNNTMPKTILAGATREEARLYLVPGGSISKISAEDVNSFITDAKLPPNTAERYRQQLAADKQSNGEILCAIQSDYYYREPARRIAEHAADCGSKAYSYEFCWQSNLYEGQLGAAHGVELPFMFNNLHNDTARHFIDVDKPVSNALVSSMHQAWVSFAKTGEPGWPAQEKGQRSMMLFGDGESIERLVSY